MSFRVCVLVSGEGSNLQALLDDPEIDVVAVASSRAAARGLERARAAGVETGVFEARERSDRPARDESLARWIAEREVDLVVLAGFMEVLSTDFVRRFRGRLINVHPSLLPAFPGLHAIEQAVAYGVRLMGVTVHFVDEGVDSGPIIAQRFLRRSSVCSGHRGDRDTDPRNRARIAARDGATARGRGGEDRPCRAASRDHRRGRAMAATEGGPAAITEPGAVRVRRALLTVSDKRGLVDFARGLSELGVEIVSTGGTAGVLGEEGIATRPIDDYTGFPEMLDGRVKTLNPRIYAGLLAVRSNPEHMATLAQHDVEPIDLVCVNLYPFERTASMRGASDAEVIEQIDIGGPTLIRAAAKNHPFSAVVVTPESYDAVLEELRASDGRLSRQTREALAMDAFAYTARYDAAIARWFSEREDDFPALYPRVFEKVLDLAYGENPHQRAAYYAQAGARTHLLSMVSKLHGKELSFNNLLDLDSARRLVDEFEIPAAAIIKHNNPCGVALAGSVARGLPRLPSRPTR